MLLFYLALGSVESEKAPTSPSFKESVCGFLGYWYARQFLWGKVNS